MANLVRINNVSFYASFDNVDVFACKQLLDQNNIPYQFLVYPEASSLPSLFAALSTWSFGPNFTQYNFTKTPLIIWTEYYDDYERYLNISLDSTNLATSNLLTNASLITGYNTPTTRQAVITGYIDSGLGGGAFNNQPGKTLTVTSVTSGTIEPAMALTGSGINGILTIASFGSQGTSGTGGTGTYYLVGQPEAVASTTITASIS